MKDLKSLRKHYRNAHQQCPKEKIVNSKRKRDFAGEEKNSEKNSIAEEAGLVAIAMVTTTNDLDEAPSHSQ